MSKVYRKIVGGGKYIPWKYWAIGDYVEGKFLGTSTDQFDKINYQFEVTECNLDESIKNKADAETEAANLTVKVGDILILNSMGSLDYKMQSVEKDQIIKVTYQGTTKLPANHKYKNKESHQVDIEVAEFEESTRGL